VRQFNVFVANRVGGLMHVVRRYETTDIRIVSLTVVDSADCAHLSMMVLSDPERELEIFRAGGAAGHRAICSWCSCPKANSRCKSARRLLAARSTSTTPIRCSSAPMVSRPWRLRRGPRDRSADAAAQSFTLFTENDLNEEG
jgi:hypothetical protein